MSQLFFELLLLGAGTATLIWLSRNSLRHPGRHGYYRFFAWEAILVLFVLNLSEQTIPAFHFVSTILMPLSIGLVFLGHHALRSQGAASNSRDDSTLFSFEKTTALVTSGIFKYIRHPMYASLLALAWGTYFQAPTWPGTVLASAASILLLLTAKAEERESLAYFGEAYAAYMRRTRRFIPYLY